MGFHIVIWVVRHVFHFQLLGCACQDRGQWAMTMLLMWSLRQTHRKNAQAASEATRLDPITRDSAGRS